MDTAGKEGLMTTIRTRPTYTVTTATFPAEQRLAALPEPERALVEAMVSELCQVKGVGRLTALEIVWAAGRWVRRGK